MNPDESMSRIFAVVGLILGVLAAIAGLLLQSWLPLVAVGVVLLCVMGLTMSESALFAPMLNLVMRAGEREKAEKEKKKLGYAKPQSGISPQANAKQTRTKEVAE